MPLPSAISALYEVGNRRNIRSSLNLNPWTAIDSGFKMVLRTCTTKTPTKDLQTSKNDTRPVWMYPDLVAQLYIHAAAAYGIYRACTSAKLLTSLWCRFQIITIPNFHGFLARGMIFVLIYLTRPHDIIGLQRIDTFFLNTLVGLMLVIKIIWIPTGIFMIYTSGIGITAGVHRLWSHRSYRARLPLRLLLAFLFTITGQRDIYSWALDHRIHHQYSETNADPHNAKRGFWFSHIGWLVMTPHPDVVSKRSQIRMDDLDADPIVRWQRRLIVPLFASLCVAAPVLVPWYFWSEGFIDSLFISFNLRFAVTLNIAYSVNSFAHMYGTKPFDKNISPTENMGVALTSLGEGWHNYHHVFPWDYKASEIGQCFNPTTKFIDFMAKLGWAYDRKFPTASAVLKRASRTGDGSKTNESDSLLQENCMLLMTCSDESKVE